MDRKISSAPAGRQDGMLEDRAIFDNAAVGIAFTRDRLFKRCNSRFAQMFGHAEAALIGQPAAIIYPSPEAYAALGDAARPVLSAGEDFQTDIELRRRDGSDFWCRLYGRAVDPAHPGAGTVWIAEDITEQRRSQTREAEAREELAAVLETAVLGIAVVRERVLHRCNRRFEELFGHPPGAMLGKSTRLWYATEEDFLGLGAAAYPQMVDGSIHRREQLLRRADGTTFWGRLSGRAFDPKLVQAGSVWVLEDVSERRRQEAQLRAALDEQQLIFANAAVGILLVRAHTVQRCNSTLEAMFGYAKGELDGCSTVVLHVDAAAWEERIAAAYADLRRGDVYRCECEVRRKDGSHFWVRGTAHRTGGNALPPSADETLAVIWIFEDITERRAVQDALLRAHEELERRVCERTAELALTNRQLQGEVLERMQAEARVWQIAHHDALTGLPNRSLLHDRLQHALAQAERNARKLALLFVDLDHFKQINDTLGHDVGDSFLRGIAVRIRGAVRAADTVARFGGDEFVVLLPEVGGGDDAAGVAAKVLEALKPPVEAGGRPLHPSASIGISVYPDDAADAAALMRNADTAMYQAKEAGRNDYRLFASHMNEDTARYFGIEQGLREVLERDELRLHYQPCVDLSGGGIVGFEALLRWQQPGSGLLLPDEFLPVAEESGMILPIGDWVLNVATAQAASLGLPVAVNLSPRQFWKRTLVDELRDLLAATRLPAGLLQIEVREAALMRDVGATADRLAALADLGLAVAVDAYGTGYSSLRVLKRFALRRLKIDRSLIADMCSGDGAGIVAAVIALSRSLRLEVTAVGVENETQAAALMELGCGCAQGSYFAPPLAADELAGRLAGSKAR